MKRLHVRHSKRQALVMRRSCAMNAGQVAMLAATVAAVMAAAFAVAWAVTWIVIELSRSLS